MKTIIPILLIVTIFSGCAGSPVQTGWEAEDNRKAMLGLKTGMTKSQVLKIMGEPRKTEVYTIEKRNIEFWLYLTEGKSVYGSLGDANYTPLAFENGTLRGWGRNYYDKTMKYEHKIDIK